MTAEIKESVTANNFLHYCERWSSVLEPIPKANKGYREVGRTESTPLICLELTMAWFAKIGKDRSEPRGGMHVFHVRTKFIHLFRGKNGTLLQHLWCFILYTPLET
jgi:hypothetical protein